MTVASGAVVEQLLAELSMWKERAEKAEAALTLDRITNINVSRCERWHRIEDWPLEKWAIAFAGEAGELCNAVKKLWRIEDGIKPAAGSANDPPSREAAVQAIGDEFADTFFYGDLLMCRIGLRSSIVIPSKFNAVSAKYGFPERM